MLVKVPAASRLRLAACIGGTAMALLTCAACGSSGTPAGNSTPTVGLQTSFPVRTPAQLAPLATRQQAARILTAAVAKYPALLEAAKQSGATAQVAQADQVQQTNELLAAFTAANALFTSANEPPSVGDFRDDSTDIPQHLDELRVKEAITGAVGEGTSAAVDVLIVKVQNDIDQTNTDIANVLAGR